VYDALNVLMAMDIISKEKKEIRWRGLPSNTGNDIEVLQREKTQRMSNMLKKNQHLKDLMDQHIAFKGLVQRNSKPSAGASAASWGSAGGASSTAVAAAPPLAALAAAAAPSSFSSSTSSTGSQRPTAVAVANPTADTTIQLPFILVTTKLSTTLECQMSDDRYVPSHSPPPHPTSRAHTLHIFGRSFWYLMCCYIPLTSIAAPQVRYLPQLFGAFRAER
jgi:hypothetical protein